MTGRTVVFCGPSISQRDAEALLPDAEVRPPACRDDLITAQHDGARVVALIDGAFGGSQAVSPGEVVDVISAGTCIWGASSMGAIRAAECWPAGMLGHGLVYRLFRRRVLNDDDEVAVMTSADDGWAASTLALVNVRVAARRAVPLGILTPPESRHLVEVVERMNFGMRSLPSIRTQLEFPMSQPLADLLARTDVKKSDAASLLAVLRRTPAPSPTRTHLAARRVRYKGHDRFYGNDDRAVRRAFLRWMVGSGRYRQYLASGEPGHHWSTSPQMIAAHGCPSACARGFDWERIGNEVWTTAERRGELDAELERMFALAALASTGSEPSLDCLALAKYRVATCHGYRTWQAFADALQQGECVTSLIPSRWVDGAVKLLAAGMSRPRSESARIEAEMFSLETQ